ncbi:hypothetical protein ACHQM5_007602 [Ranunculus cassubicifolius]
MADSVQNSIVEEDEVSDVQKGGFKTMPFIIANETFQSVATTGILPNMILYLINSYHMDTATGVSVLSIWSAASDFLAICGAFISDSYLGKFRVIIVGSFITVIGMTLLWLTAMVPQARPSACNPSSSECQSSTFSQQAFLLSSLGLISLGGGCIKPCSMAFGADQFMNRGNSGKNDRLVQSYFNWYYAFEGISSVIALTVIVYIQDHLGWKVGFGVPAILMLLSTLFFMVGSPLYVKMKAHNSLLTGLAQVPVAAFRNRHLVIPPDNSDGLYCQGRDSNFIVPSDKLSFLNKACIVKHPEEDFNDDDSVAKPWDLCTIDQVETIKALIYVIPIWSTGIITVTPQTPKPSCTSLNSGE